MNDTYEAWVMMNSENDVVTEEYDNPEEALKEMQDRGYNSKKLYVMKYINSDCRRGAMSLLRSSMFQKM